MEFYEQNRDEKLEPRIRKDYELMASKRAKEKESFRGCCRCKVKFPTKSLKRMAWRTKHNNDLACPGCYDAYEKFRKENGRDTY